MPNRAALAAKFMADYSLIPDDPPPRSSHNPTLVQIDHNRSWAYFDGAAQEQGCGVGILLHKTENHLFRIHMGLGMGTNNYAELISLRHLLHFSLAHACNHIQIFGDSKIIINWFKNTSACHMHSLRNILDEIMILKAQFIYISCQRIYRERNMVADQLSKEATYIPEDCG